MLGLAVIAAAILWLLVRTFKAWYRHDVQNINDGRWNKV